MVKFVLLLSSKSCKQWDGLDGVSVFFSYILLLYIPQFFSLHSLIYEKTLKIMALLLIFALCYFSLTSLPVLVFSFTHLLHI